MSRLANKVGLRALHCLNAEAAHNATIKLLKAGVPFQAKTVRDPRLRYTLSGVEIDSPVGMAAGFDKNAEVPDALLKLGFGFVEVGTVTPRPQAGNPKPRNFRLSADKAVINRYGFNNDGHGAVYGRLAARQGSSGVVGVNIGANKDSEDRIKDYVRGIECFADVASYFTANISSPNTPGLRDLQAKSLLEDLVGRIIEARDEQIDKIGRSVPVLLKIAPDVSEKALEDIVSVVKDKQLDGFIISNTTISRPDLLDKVQAKETGGLSGAPLFRLSTVVLAKARRLAGPELPIIGVGGIDSGESAWAKITAGANLVQLYSGMVYKGAGLIQEINDYLIEQLDQKGLSNLQDAVGQDVEVWANEELV
ncbi:quinone-dependent dihydroorotate dehydrogenase [Flexibacterium corallicola]|uniref:quinone-dependent dihydroorotate dehydrogenase n=1 Tax=Flexibacterium corallicola TaxID=3037259 RepID=UPI0038621DDE